MSCIHPKVSLSTLCGLFGYSRQSWYKVQKTSVVHESQQSGVIALVKEIREDQPRIGGIKLLYLVNQELKKAGDKEIGRDWLYNLLRSNKMLVRPAKKNKPASTNGHGRSIYADLRKDLNVLNINELWSSDITYICVDSSIRHCYVTFVVDEKSHKIVGHHLSTDMTAKETLRALQIAVMAQGVKDDKFQDSLIFHSDRGSQFKSLIFQDYLKSHGIRGSMAQEGKSSENPVSERLNGIIKNELLITDSFKSVAEARSAIDRAVKIYNEKRPHLSCELLTPQQAHQSNVGVLKKLWRQRKPHHKKIPD
jgi:transposase InsO family protein